MLPPAQTGSASFHAQQAAEKALKGYLVSLGVERPPRTHDLLVLAGMIKQRGGSPPPESDLRVLNQHGVASRYPPAPPPTEAEAERALAMAEEVV